MARARGPYTGKYLDSWGRGFSANVIWWKKYEKGKRKIGNM
jgi:hypothetical protein